MLPHPHCWCTFTSAYSAFTSIDDDGLVRRCLVGVNHGSNGGSFFGKCFPPGTQDNISQPSTIELRLSEKESHPIAFSALPFRRNRKSSTFKNREVGRYTYSFTSTDDDGLVAPYLSQHVQRRYLVHFQVLPETGAIAENCLL